MNRAPYKAVLAGAKKAHDDLAYAREQLGCSEPVEGAEPVGYMHRYRKINGGAKYTELNHGEAHQGQEPKDGFEWYASEPVFTHPAPASAQAGAVPEAVDRLKALAASYDRRAEGEWVNVGVQISLREVAADIRAAIEAQAGAPEGAKS